MGAVKGALDIFQQIHAWEDVVYCYQSLGWYSKVSLLGLSHFIQSRVCAVVSLFVPDTTGTLAFLFLNTLVFIKQFSRATMYMYLPMMMIIIIIIRTIIIIIHVVIIITIIIIWKDLKTTLQETPAEVGGFSTRKNKDWFDENDNEIRKSLPVGEKCFAYQRLLSNPDSQSASQVNIKTGMHHSSKKAA